MNDQVLSTGAFLGSAMPSAVYAFITQDLDATAVLVIVNVVLFMIAQGFIFLRWYLDRRGK